VIKDGDAISSLELKDGSVITADLFVDCTGFLQLLRKSTDRINLEGRLFVNTV
jgi:2-polyprenyl-6-methoxyphenol hydroxylase-like FAD-dependent oxidoreductase